MANYNIYHMLSSLPCHFTWDQLKLQNAGRTVQMNIENLEEHIEQTIHGTEVESYNLMGFYQTQKKSFVKARYYFNKALEKTKTEDGKIVCLGCLAWLTWKEESADSSAQDLIFKKFTRVIRILRGREDRDIPEVMAEKAFSIANSGYFESGFQEALVCIDRALKEDPKNVMFKFTKVLVMQQLYKARKKQVDQHDPTVNDIKKLWVEIMNTLENCPYLDVMYGQALVQYALFLAKINKHDNGAEEYAKRAEDVASSNHAVMRNVAKFYISTAQWSQIYKLEKAEVILKNILGIKADKAVYKELSLLGELLLKKYRMKPDEETFVEAEDCLRKSWASNKKYIILAIDLSFLYQEKYNKTKDIAALEAKNILFQEIFSYFEEQDETSKANFYSVYANFLKDYGLILASHHQATPSSNDSMNGGIKHGALEQASKLLCQYESDRDDTKLLKAEQKFREMYGNLEQLTDPYKTLFHQKYGSFLKTYSKDLAFYYLVKSLTYNPSQKRKYTYEPLEKLAQEKIHKSQKEEKEKGYEALEMMKKLQQN